MVPRYGGRLTSAASVGSRAGGASAGKGEPVRTVIFACVHNAGRSQMAAAYFNALCDPAKARARSAGTRPAERVHPEVVEAMREQGIDLGGVRPQLLTPELAAGADLLVTMGCGEDCPLVPGLAREDWPLEDPAGLSLVRVRVVRDHIRARVETLLAARGWKKSRR
jgi:arsenate reductase